MSKYKQDPSYTRSYYLKNKERIDKRNNAYMIKNKAVRMKQQAEYRESNPLVKKDYYQKNKEQLAAKRFGISLEEYQALIKESEGVCYICKTEAKLHIDHNHTTGKVRKLLCRLCNTALGMIKENHQTALNLAAYIELFTR